MMMAGGSRSLHAAIDGDPNGNGNGDGDGNGNGNCRYAERQPQRSLRGTSTPSSSCNTLSAGPSISSNCPLSDILKNTHIAANTIPTLTGTSK